MQSSSTSERSPFDAVPNSGRWRRAWVRIVTTAVSDDPSEEIACQKTEGGPPAALRENLTVSRGEPVSYPLTWKLVEASCAVPCLVDMSTHAVQSAAPLCHEGEYRPKFRVRFSAVSKKPIQLFITRTPFW